MSRSYRDRNRARREPFPRDRKNAGGVRRRPILETTNRKEYR